LIDDAYSGWFLPEVREGPGGASGGARADRRFARIENAIHAGSFDGEARSGRSEFGLGDVPFPLRVSPIQVQAMRLLLEDPDVAGPAPVEAASAAPEQKDDNRVESDPSSGDP
jgi:hypothetical protein